MVVLVLRVNLDQAFQLGTTSRDLLITAGWCFRHPWVEARDAAKPAEQPPLPASQPGEADPAGEAGMAP